MPLTLIALVLGAWFWWRAHRSQKRWRKPARLGPALVIGATAFLWLLSTEPVSNAMLWSLEGRYQPLQTAAARAIAPPANPAPAHQATTEERASEAPVAGAPPPETVETQPASGAEAQAIVVLGGGHHEREGFGPLASLQDWSRARTTEAVRLSRLTDLPLWFSGYSGAGQVPNAVMARDAAVALGVRRGRTRVFPSPRNTAEEAAVIAAALGTAPAARAAQSPIAGTQPPPQTQPPPPAGRPPNQATASGSTIILVTSASHMRRAKWLFEQQGLDVIPAPADYQAASRNYTAWDFIPNAAALQRAERAWYEWMGLAWAKLTH